MVSFGGLFNHTCIESYLVILPSLTDQNFDQVYIASSCVYVILNKYKISQNVICHRELENSHGFPVPCYTFVASCTYVASCCTYVASCCT